MATRINRAIELLAQDQAIYYVGQHTGHVLSYAQGREDAHTWADYINVGMEHGSFDMPGLAEYLRGLVDGGPTRSGHRTPAVIVEPPARGIDEASVRNNAWQVRQILARGVHGIVAVPGGAGGRRPGLRGVGALPAPRSSASIQRCPLRSSGCGARRRAIAPAARAGHPCSASARAVAAPRRRLPRSGASRAQEYMERSDPWPLNPQR